MEMAMLAPHQAIGLRMVSCGGIADVEKVAEMHPEGAGDGREIQ